MLGKNVARIWIFSWIAFCTVTGFGVQIVTEGSNLACESFELNKPLRVYKDPTIFLPTLELINSDPQFGWKELFRESPVLTTLSGSVHLMRLPTREFRNFGAIARLYEFSEPRFVGRLPEEGMRRTVPIIVPVKICGGGSASPPARAY